jgi:hypothetical protein
MQNLPDLAVLWSLGLIAVIISVNAKGTARISLSWFFTAAVVTLCISASILKVSALKNRLLDGASAEPPAEMSAPVNPVPAQPSNTKTQTPGPSSASVSSTDQTKDYLEQASRIVGTALGCAGAINSFDIDALANIADSQYEREQSRALSLRNQSSSISRQVKSLQVPQNLAWLQADLDKATENLRLAGWAVHAYFAAENNDDEKAMQDQFTRYSRTAQTDLRLIQQELLRQR